MNRRSAVLLAGAVSSWLPVLAIAADRPPPPRVEARSTDLLAVGVVHDDRMVIRLSRILDNAPVSDAAVAVRVRGNSYPATAEADGSYVLQTKDLGIPGSAVVEFQITEGAAHRNLKGTLQVVPTDDKPDDKNSARQLGWWVLNFSVCIGFLWLISRRRKTAQS